MPRIDPIQLLNCLSVLLSPNGGIKSRNEVQRLAGLMTKFSKKLVSKCIYIQILKCTETELLGSFMGSGGWLLVHMWLTESIVAKNWPLVRELLELLLLCPVDIERLKTNNCPKLVKELSKDGNHFAIRALASKLVEQWLKIVKGADFVPIQESEIALIILNAQSEVNAEDTKSGENADDDTKEQNDTESERKSEIDSCVKTESVSSEDVGGSEDRSKQIKEGDEEQESLPVLKIKLKDGKQIITQVDDEESKEESSDTEKSKDRSKSKEKTSDRRSSSSSKSSSSKHSSKSHSSSSEKHKSSHKSSSSSSSSSRHRNKDDKAKDKDRHSSKSKSDSSRKSGDKLSTSSSKSKEDRNVKPSDRDKYKDKDKNHERDKSLAIEKNSDKIKVEKSKDTQKLNDKVEDKTHVPSIQKLGKIPKLSDVKKEKSISIVVRKPDEPKPKTVKTFHSKFRKHGLEEEVKPPPSRASLLNKKVTPALPPTVSIPKRPSPVHNESPPEKKPKTVEPIEKPGSIKLIPPKPKRDIPICVNASSTVGSLVNYYVGGKSKMYNLSDSTVLLVKIFLQIKAEFITNVSFNIDLNLFKE